MRKYICSTVFALLTFAGGFASAQNIGQAAQQPDGGCTTALDRCAPVPTPQACPAGQKWSLAGSGIAHCVNADPTCTGNTELYHDFMGNPSCVGPVITSENRDVGCPAGYSGYNTQTRSVSTYPSGRVVYGSWVTTDNECEKDVPPPTPSCPNGATDYPTCSSTGSPTGPTNGGGNCSASQVWDGSSCLPRCSGSDTWNGSSCVGQTGTCNTSTVPSSQSCPLGQTGSLTFSNVVDCHGNVLSSTQTGGSCQTIPEKPPMVCPAAWFWQAYYGSQSGDPRDEYCEWGYSQMTGPNCDQVENWGQGSGQCGDIKQDSSIPVP
jgi:hypothetical protein